MTGLDLELVPRLHNVTANYSSGISFTVFYYSFFSFSSSSSSSSFYSFFIFRCTTNRGIRNRASGPISLTSMFLIFRVSHIARFLVEVGVV